MAKKLVTIDVNDKELTVSAKPVKAREVKKTEATEMEKLGFVEINSAKTAKTSKAIVVKGYEKNISEGTKRGVKAQTSLVEDYFDFSFRKNEKAKEEITEKKAVKTTTKKATTKTSKATTTKKSTKKDTASVIKIDENLKLEQNSNVENTVNFDSEAYNIIRVARIGSLFDCDKRIIEA